jgi:hypothetical protein
MEGRLVSNCATSNSWYPVISRIYSEDPKRSVTSSQGIHGHIPVMATFKRNYSVIKGIIFEKRNRGTSVIGLVWIATKLI